MTSNETVVDHVLLLKLRDDITPQQQQAFENGARSLITIPGVKNISVGPTFYDKTFMEKHGGDRRGGYTHAVCIRLESKEALETYLNHEVHLRVKKECLVPVLAGPPMAVDWESVVTTAEE